jgi:uncharacterized membrane protein YbhN (UPF0104 family)
MEATVSVQTLDPPTLADPGAGEPAAVRPRARLLRATKVAASLLGAMALLVVGLPRVAGAHWGSIAGVLQQLPLLGFLGLTLLWLAGLFAHTYVNTAALPGLTKRRALFLSLTGSSVSNVLPFGGALGVALNYSMVRAWGHSRAAFVLFAVTTQIWGVGAKLCLPALGLGVLLLSGGATSQLLLPTVIAVAGLLLLGGLFVAAIARADVAARLGRLGERVVAGVARALRRPREVCLEAAALELRRQGIELMRRAWVRLSVGMIVYFALQAVLLWACLGMVGASLLPAAVFAAFALERLLTVVYLTPGGLGVVEVGMTAMLVAFGGAALPVAAGVLLYRAFTYALEIPVGGVLLVGWFGMRRRLLTQAQVA